MDFSNDTLNEMRIKKDMYNTLYSNWYLEMSKEFKDLTAYSDHLIKKSDRIRSCLNLWSWDVYHKNKLMDLQKVNRCMNNRFCPNCRKWDLAGAIHNLSKPFNMLLNKGYYPYLVTLTVPNVDAEALKGTIDKMNKAFKKVFGAFNYTLTGTTKGFSERYIEVAAALKVLEITYNSVKDTYHPHFHCIFFSEDYDEGIFIKDIPGEWSSKRQSYNFYSLMDIQVMKLWTMFYTNTRLTANNYNGLNTADLFLCDIREMDSSGIVEVLKYTFKDTDIVKYDVFKIIEIALENKRIRQGYGLLYNLKLEGETEGDKLSLMEFLTEIEEPEKLLTQGIEQLINEFKEYRKISRSKAHDT
jgi:plasmid rolling circle replication initiator protein Rep